MVRRRNVRHGQVGQRQRQHRGVRAAQNTSNEETFESITWVSGSPDSVLQNLFLQRSKFLAHCEAQDKYPHRYFACLQVLIKNDVQVLENSKVLALAAAWARKDYLKAEYLLKLRGEMFAIKEVLKAVMLLDVNRKRRAHERIVRRLEVQGCKKKHKMDSLKSTLGTLQSELIPYGSLSSSLIRHIKKWLKTIPSERLEFFAMHFPPLPWKKLADLCHLNPKKDMPQCSWFLPFCFGGPVPESTTRKSTITGVNISELVLTQEIDYTVARQWKDYLNVSAKERIARYTKLDTVLWYYEELATGKVDQVIYEKFKAGEKLALPYGKLMERLLYLKFNKGGNQPFLPYLMADAEKRLKELSFSLDNPVVVIGDRSSSMNVAIRTSNIIASLLTAVTKAELVFFDTENTIPPFVPKDVDGVLRLCDKIYGRYATAPAVSLYPYYKEKKVVKTFIVVTDEDENVMSDNHFFHKLFAKYYHEIYPARLVFISFLSQNQPGKMVSALREQYPEIHVMQFRFDVNRPDLTKLDGVLGLLSADSEKFVKQTDEVEKIMSGNHLKC